VACGPLSIVAVAKFHKTLDSLSNSVQGRSTHSWIKRSVLRCFYKAINVKHSFSLGNCILVWRHFEHQKKAPVEKKIFPD
jgi:hypothetical protein